MEAVLVGQADEVAYSVTDAAGIEWLTPTIWFRRRQPMNAELARAILAQGKKDGTHEAPIPEDDAKAISDAEDLVSMAQTAWDQHVRGPEVEILLKMSADGAENGGPPPKEEEPISETPPESESAEESEEPKAEETPEEDTRPPIPEEEKPPPDPDLLDVEPWENYARESVAMVISGIDSGLKEMSADEFRDLMAHVWAYEQEHKNRATVLDHLERVAKKLAKQSKGEAPVGQPPEEQFKPPEQTPPMQTPESASDAEPEKDNVVDLGERREPPPSEQQQDQEDDYNDLMKMIESELADERVHKPEAPSEKIPDLPWDWTKMSDSDLQKFHGMYSVVAYYKNYQLAREERIALACRMAADELHNELMIRLPKYDERDREKRVALVEAEVESDENIKKWRRRQRKHEVFATSHRFERDSIARIVEALSRHETMRHDEWERSGKLENRRR